MNADPRVARSRARILEAATELLVHGGVRAVTVDAVAKRSGVAKSTMYRHFRSHAELLVAMLRHNVPDLDIEIPPGSFAEGVHALVGGFAVSMADPGWARILPALLSLKNTMPDVYALTERERAVVRGKVRDVLGRGVAEGLQVEDVDIATTVDVLIGPLVLAVINDEVARLDSLADEVSSRFVDSCRQRTRPDECVGTDVAGCGSDSIAVRGLVEAREHG